MTPEIEEAISRGAFDLAKSIMLNASTRSRTVVGLPVNSGLSPLQVASLYDRDAALFMIEMGHQPDLHVACALGLNNIVKDIANRYPELFEAELEHIPPLGIAILKGQTKTVKTLLSLGDNPNRPIKRVGWFLWEIKAIDKGFSAWYPVHMAAVHGYQEAMGDILRALVTAGASPSLTSPLGKRAIHLSVTPNWTHLTNILLDLGCDIEARTTPIGDGMHGLSGSPIRNAQHAHHLTPLMVAIKEGHLEATTALINRNADLRARDSNGWTPLHHAAWPWWEENAKIAETLIDSGADTNAKTMDGRTPCDLAKEAKFIDTVEILSR
jgi:ankyrin repeat protein